METTQGRIRNAASATLLLLGLLLPGAAGGESSGVQLTIDTDRIGPRVSPYLWGAFFEEINHAGDGGLYAELVRNRSFEDGPLPAGWKQTSTSGRMQLDATHPLNGATPTCLLLEPGPTGVSVVNEGFWGMGFAPGATYRFSCFARAENPGDLLVRLESTAGKVVGTATARVESPSWRPLNLRIRTREGDAGGKLALSWAGPSELRLDVVSLFPEQTWKRRRNGLRTDLAGMVERMRPAFLRFPGGCYCEGDRLANAFRWKKSVGPIAERPGHWNLWGYRSSDGLGFHEYLQWCEDLRAAPMFVVNCGMAHEDVAPLDKLDEWIQDAIDAVEYANGPVTSRWGAMRAANGHPRPFNLRYLEIGNENGWGNTLPRYEERYTRFWDALKKRFPEVRLIANVPVRSRPMEVVDEHYYNSAEWFLGQTRRYDTYSRQGPRIYVGEYAVTQGCGEGNLRAAIGEAAFMTGLERNSDIVEMASYAPLFVHTRDRKWNPDAIVFDSSRAFGTPSYWVQRMFAENRVDQVVHAEVADSRLAEAAPGGVGLGTWRTAAEYDDVLVKSGTVALLAEGFGAAPTAWKVKAGDWQVREGVYRQSDQQEDRRATAGSPTWTDYTYTVRARKLAGAEGFLIMFRVRGDGDFYWWNLGGWNNTRHAIEKAVGGAKTILVEQPGSIEAGRWYDIKVELAGDRIRCYLDGRLIHDVRDQGPPRLSVSAGRVDATGDLVVKVVNASSAAVSTRLRLRGGMRPGSARITMMQGRPEDENSFAQPTKIAPTAGRPIQLRDASPLTFPPSSVSIIRIERQ